MLCCSCFLKIWEWFPLNSCSLLNRRPLILLSNIGHTPQKALFICITVILHSENQVFLEPYFLQLPHTLNCTRVPGPVTQFLFKIVSQETPWSVYFFRRGLALVTSLPWHWVSLQKRVRGFETAATARKEQLPTVGLHSFIFQMETMKLQDVVTNGG